ncbi:flavodoxin [Streptomyces sp. NBC_00203]|uniref:flavodoxin n=1 Tax=Streptomyces sp. NBC_00203 TaxID=2975680 RepID=UPI00325101F5
MSQKQNITDVLMVGATGSIGRLATPRRRSTAPGRGWALMTSIYATLNDIPGDSPWKRRSERLLPAGGLPYTIVRPGWFDHTGPTQRHLVLEQGGTVDGGIAPSRNRRRTASGLNTGEAKPATLGRRTLLRGVLLGGATVMTGVQIAGCSTSSPSGAARESAERPASAASAGKRVLLAYFSRPGENYSYGGRTNLRIGNTEVLAGMISDRIECDVYRIEAVDPYADDYDETVARNAREQDADARPAIANLPSSMERYDTVLLGSPIWNVRAPMIMTTFTATFDFHGKTVFPFTTYAMSGLGTNRTRLQGVLPRRDHRRRARGTRRGSPGRRYRCPIVARTHRRPPGLNQSLLLPP